MYAEATERIYSTQRSSQASGREIDSLRDSDSRKTGNQRREQRILRNRIRRQQEIRRHFLLFLMTLCLIIACSFTLNTFRSNAKNEPDLSHKYYKSIIISSTDTLWSIAAEYMDEEHYESITDYIDEIKSMNSLAGDSIHYGEYLIVPYYASYMP